MGGCDGITVGETGIHVGETGLYIGETGLYVGEIALYFCETGLNLSEDGVYVGEVDRETADGYAKLLDLSAESIFAVTDRPPAASQLALNR